MDMVVLVLPYLKSETDMSFLEIFNLFQIEFDILCLWLIEARDKILQ